ncbi:MAG: dTMP kinase [Alphaproteobacteria bacterium]|nr:dTMP kinase [Alphaproteobacteria bacterium]
MTKGKFITLEGGEGAGKSTQTKLLADFLRRKGLKVIETREVGGSPSAEAIRDLWLAQKDKYWDPLTELLLIMAARREHLVKTVFPALSEGAWVVCDRFADSTRAYQGIGLGLGLEPVENVYKLIAPDFEPDLTLLLDLPVETGLARMESRGGMDDRYQQQLVDFHKKLREAFLSLAQKFPVRFRTIDASGDAPGIAASIERAVAERFFAQESPQ